MVEVQLVMPLSAVKAEVVFKFGNFAFSALCDSKQNVLFELMFIAFLFVTYNIIVLYILGLFFVFIVMLIQTRLKCSLKNLALKKYI